MAGTRISVRLDGDLQVSLSAEAEATGKKPSDIVREALQARLRRHKKQMSAYDLAKQIGFLGACTTLPPDLRTNPKYLEGFGKKR